MTLSRIHEYERRYGPYGFSLITLLALWFWIVNPTIERNQVDTRTILQASEQTRAAADSLKETSRTLERTADQVRAAADTNKEVAALLRLSLDKAQAIIENSKRP